MIRIRRAIERGLYQTWLSQGLRQFSRLKHLGLEGSTDNDESGPSQAEVERELTRWKAVVGNKRLTLEHTSGAFMLLLFGSAVALVVFVLESKCLVMGRITVMLNRDTRPVIDC